jgi:phage gpG-like protein
MRLAKAMKYSGALDKNAMRQVLKEGTIRPWLAKIASLAEAIVAGAFESAGYGQWPAWKNKNYINEAMMLLVDSGQLRDSISSEIKEDK